MINEQIMIETVGRMMEAGIDDATVISTLVDTGVTQDEAYAIVQKVKSPKQVPAQAQAPAQPQSQDIQLIKSQIEVQAQSQELNDTSVHNKLDLHEQKIDDVAKKVDEVKSVVSSAQNIPIDAVLSARVSALEGKLEEVNSMTKANYDLLKNILDTNRKILTELEAKK